MRKLFSGFPTRSYINKDVQQQKMARGLKFLSYEVEGLYYLCTRNKGADQLHGYRYAPLFSHMHKADFLMTWLK